MIWQGQGGSKHRRYSPCQSTGIEYGRNLHRLAVLDDRHVFRTVVSDSTQQPSGDHDRIDRRDPRERGATSNIDFVAYRLRSGSHDILCGFQLSIDGMRGPRFHSIDDSHGGSDHRPVADFDCRDCFGSALAAGHPPGVHLVGRWPVAKLGWKLATKK